MPLVPAHQARLNVWVNNADIKGASKTTHGWVFTHHKKLAEFIEKKYTNKNSRKSHFSTLALVIKNLKGDEDPIYQKYSKISTDIDQLVKAESKTQKLSPAREKNWVDWKELMEKRAELKKRSEKSKGDFELNSMYLLLSLYTYQPPIRREWANMKITEEKPNPTERDKYYLWIDEKHDKMTVYIRDKKYSKIGIGKIEIESETLKQLIRNSLKRFPREYVLANQKNADHAGPLDQGFTGLMKKIFKKKSVGVDLLRSAYVSHFYESKSMDEESKRERHTLADKEALAKKMRHTADTAQREYQRFTAEPEAKERKVETDSDTETDESESEDEEYKERKARLQRKWRRENKDKIKKYNQQYQEKNRHAHNRATLIDKLNKGENLRPNAASIAYYDLEQDPKTGIWS